MPLQDDPLPALKRRVDALFTSAAGRVGPSRDDLAQFVDRLHACATALLRERFPAEPGGAPKRPCVQPRESVVCSGSWESRRASVQQLEAELGEGGVYETVTVRLSTQEEEEGGAASAAPPAPLVVRQFREYFFSSGCRIWDASVALARQLQREGAAGGLAGLAVVELGSGVGLPGLAAARFAARVLLTDAEDALLPNLRANAAAVGAAGTVEVAQLNWSTAPQELRERHGGAFDLLLASDLVYSSGCVEGLLGTAAALLRPGGRLRMCYPHGRHGQQAFLEALEGAGWAFAPPARLPPALLEGCAHQGSEEEARAHAFYLLDATRPPGADVAEGEHVEAKVALYRNGFTVNGGPLRALDDPANASFLQDMARGAAPRELGPRGQVSVEMVDKRGEDYDEPGHPSGSAQR